MHLSWQEMSPRHQVCKLLHSHHTVSPLQRTDCPTPHLLPSSPLIDAPSSGILPPSPFMMLQHLSYYHLFPRQCSNIGHITTFSLDNAPTSVILPPSPLTMLQHQSYYHLLPWLMLQHQSYYHLLPWGCSNTSHITIFSLEDALSLVILPCSPLRMLHHQSITMFSLEDALSTGHTTITNFSLFNSFLISTLPSLFF